MNSDEGGPDRGRSCQWCSATAAADAISCPGCGAALALRESLGGLVIPGVTEVHPGLRAYSADPLRIPRASPSQALAGPAMGMMAIAGPAGAALALGSLAAVTAGEYLGASRPDGWRAPLGALGVPSEAALAMARQLDSDQAAAEAPDPAATEGTSGS
jgi:hypothetical protein